MTILLALEYIPRRMSDLGIGTNYYLRYRHFVLQAKETIEIDADNQFFIQVDELADLKIQSEFGIYDVTDSSITEQDYEHQGKITLTNYASDSKHVRFIQIIPKNKPTIHP